MGVGFIGGFSGRIACEYYFCSFAFNVFSCYPPGGYTGFFRRRWSQFLVDRSVAFFGFFRERGWGSDGFGVNVTF